MTAKISAIVSTYNRARLCTEAIHSILAQSRMVDELILWDDGSTDETPKIAAELDAILQGAENMPTFRSFRAEHHAGHASSLNCALEEATGDYVWICRDSALPLPHAIDTLVAELESDPAQVAVGGRFRQFADDANTGQRHEEAPHYWPDLSVGSALRHLLEGDFLGQTAILVSRSAYEAVGPFVDRKDENIGYDMRLRLACYGPVKVLDDPVFLKRSSDDPLQHTEYTSSCAAVVSALRPRIPLGLYQGMFRSDDQKVVRRAALLQRACVFARHAEWEIAIRDYIDAAKLAPSYRLSTLEKVICKRAFGGPQFGSDTLPLDMRNSLRTVANMSAAGGSIARTLAKEMATRGRLPEAALIGRFVSSMSNLTGGHGRGERPAAIAENDSLPDHVYRVV